MNYNIIIESTNGGYKAKVVLDSCTIHATDATRRGAIDKLLGMITFPDDSGSRDSWSR